jgi:hypothetical protein
MKRSKIKFICAVQNTKWNGEDMALTPYIFLVKSNACNSRTVGLGICWIHFAIAFCLGFNIPKSFPTFRIAHTRKNKEQ